MSDLTYGYRIGAVTGMACMLLIWCSSTRHWSSFVVCPAILLIAILGALVLHLVGRKR